MSPLIKAVIAAHVFCLSAVFPGHADHHFDENAQDAISEEQQALADELTAFLDAYEIAYDNQDYATVKSMWHEDTPIYMAEEVPMPLYGWERLTKYFDPVPGRKILDGIDNEYSEVRGKYISPNIAVATYRLDYDIKLVGMPATHGWSRIMAVFIKDDDGWKLSAYTEAPQGPATMVRNMMRDAPAGSDEEKAAYATTTATIKSLLEGSVSPGFDAFMDARKDLAPTQ